MTREKADALGLTPLAEIVDVNLVGVDPVTMLEGPIDSTKKLLEDNDLSVDDIDVFEINEAFAAQALAVGKDLGWEDEKLNVNGGAIAIGAVIRLLHGAPDLVTIYTEAPGFFDALWAGAEVAAEQRSSRSRIRSVIVIVVLSGGAIRRVRGIVLFQYICLRGEDARPDRGSASPTGVGTLVLGRT